jgi:hypothetical protein
MIINPGHEKWLIPEKQDGSPRMTPAGYLKQRDVVSRT